MAILHTPRTLVSIARGFWRKRLAATTAAAGKDDVTSRFRGYVPAPDGSSNPFVYQSKPNVLWDLDYLGHMNNASYLTHAEYARWEWTAHTGVLEHMLESKTNFIVTHTAVRFRKEITGPFEIHTATQAIDDRHFWLDQTFRAPRGGRILAQVLCQAVAIQRGAIVPPSTVLERVEVPKELIDAMTVTSKTEVVRDFDELDRALRRSASEDDQRILEQATRVADTND